MPLPAESLRTNLGTWVVPMHDLPAVAKIMLDALPTEVFDPSFRGQKLVTTYFDDADYSLRKARITKQRYLTLRIRCYKSPAGDEAYALSAKTESEKWRLQIESGLADLLLAGKGDVSKQLPGHLRARLTELGVTSLVPVVNVYCRRYAVEDAEERLTLDVHVATDRHKTLGFNVLEYKSTKPADQRVLPIMLAPVKLSKFLWATEV